MFLLDKHYILHLILMYKNTQVSNTKTNIFYRKKGQSPNLICPGYMIPEQNQTVQKV